MPSDDLPTGTLQRSRFDIPRMDCPSEERLIRLALEPLPSVEHLAFDLAARTLVVLHRADAVPDLEARLGRLGLGARRVGTEAAVRPGAPAEETAGTGESRTLWTLLALNASMFVLEGVAGWMFESTGLLADGVDMLADAGVYGLALFAVGRGAAHQHRAARAAGLLQLGLAGGVLVEVARRWVAGSDPEPGWMIAVSSLALAVNVTSLLLVARHRRGGVHMKASYIFSANDVLANLGVIVAALLVAWTGSPLPDLVIGTVVAGIVGVGAFRILRLR